MVLTGGFQLKHETHLFTDTKTESFDIFSSEAMEDMAPPVFQPHRSFHRGSPCFVSTHPGTTSIFSAAAEPWRNKNCRSATYVLAKVRS